MGQNPKQTKQQKQTTNTHKQNKTNKTPKQTNKKTQTPVNVDIFSWGISLTFLGLLMSGTEYPQTSTVLIVLGECTTNSSKPRTFSSLPPLLLSTLCSSLKSLLQGGSLLTSKSLLQPPESPRPPLCLSSSPLLCPPRPFLYLYFFPFVSFSPIPFLLFSFLLPSFPLCLFFFLFPLIPFWCRRGWGNILPAFSFSSPLPLSILRPSLLIFLSHSPGPVLFQPGIFLHRHHRSLQTFLAPRYSSQHLSFLNSAPSSCYPVNGETLPGQLCTWVSPSTLPDKNPDLPSRLWDSSTLKPELRFRWLSTTLPTLLGNQAGSGFLKAMG